MAHFICSYLARTWGKQVQQALRVNGEQAGRQHKHLQGTKATRGGGAGDQSCTILLAEVKDDH